MTNYLVRAISVALLVTLVTAGVQLNYYSDDNCGNYIGEQKSGGGLHAESVNKNIGSYLCFGSETFCNANNANYIFVALTTASGGGTSGIVAKCCSPKSCTKLGKYIRYSTVNLHAEFPGRLLAERVNVTNGDQ